jgi:hypothetical protein
VAGKMTDRELLKTEFSDSEIKELREFFSQNYAKTQKRSENDF